MKVLSQPYRVYWWLQGIQHVQAVSHTLWSVWDRRHRPTNIDPEDPDIVRSQEHCSLWGMPAKTWFGLLMLWRSQVIKVRHLFTLKVLFSVTTSDQQLITIVYTWYIRSMASQCKAWRPKVSKHHSSSSAGRSRMSILCSCVWMAYEQEEQ